MRITKLARTGWMFVLVVVPVALAGHPAAGQRPPFEVPENVEMEEVKIWSEGSRLDADVFRPKDLPADAEIPAIVLGHGWGGTKRSSRRPASKFAAAGFITVGFSHRGWGASEGKMILQEEMPELDENNEATVRVRFVREVVDPLDWAEDWRHVLDWVEGEPNVDTGRIGVWGTSYGGGQVIWTAAHDDRVAAVVSQVGGMGVPWPEMKAVARERYIALARGELDPALRDVDRTGELRGSPNFASMIRYNAVEVAHRIDVPTLLIDAENEELFDRHQHSGRIYEILRTRSPGTPVRYEVIPDISHYGIYREAYERATDLALAWFEEHLSGGLTE